MATEKKRSKGRLLYLFDWNSKSRKKLFSNKSESTEVSNHGKESVDNLAIPQYLLKELCENDHSSFRGSGNFSCASSVNGDEGYGTKAPGLVARLMGLDSMPTTSCEASSISSYENRAVSSSYYLRGVDEFQREHHILDYSYAPNKSEGFPWSSTDSRTNRVHGRPIERFQTEVLPPKSAKPISITHHKLLSPIKSPAFVPTKDAADIMVAAARIIDSSPHPTGRVNIPSVGSPSSSFRLQDLREKMDSVQRSSRLSESSKTPKKSASVQQIGGNSSDRSRSGSLFKNIIDSETSSSHRVKNKGKSISVPVRDEAKMHRAEGPACHDKRSQQKGPKQLKLKHQQTSTQKAGQTKTSAINSSGVLRQNNDKQNTVAYKEKLTSKTSFSNQQPRKNASGSDCAGPRKIVSRVFVNVENGSKKVVTATKAIKKGASFNGVTDKGPSLNKKKSISRNKQSAVQENVPDKGGERSVQHDHSCQSNSGKDLDVISFTFTSPIKKPGTQSLSPTKATGSNHHHASADSCAMNSQARETSPIPTAFGLNVIDSDSLSHLLEQKLKELTDKIAPQKSDLLIKSVDADSASCLPESNSSRDIAGSTTVECNEWSDKDQTSTVHDDYGSLSLVSKSSQKSEDFEDFEEVAVSGTNECVVSRESDLGHVNISIPECSISGSCMSSSTTSDFTCGCDQPSSPQSQEVTSGISTESVHPREDDSDVADATSHWELEYVRHVLHYSGLKRFCSDKHYKIIDPAVFDLLENLINTSGRNAELCSKLERRILFDCIAETISSRYERVFLGSHKAWAKWEMLLNNECLTEDVFKEILGLQSLGTLIVDELVDRDMSTWCGRWVDFEIESLEEGMEVEEEIVAALLDELVDDLCIESFAR